MFQGKAQVFKKILFSFFLKIFTLLSARTAKFTWRQVIIIIIIIIIIS